MPVGSRTRFRVTCFHYPDNEEQLQRILDVSWVSKAVMQEELCPDTNRLHMQAYFETNVRLTYLRFKRKLAELGWIDASVRSADASSWVNYQYCTKTESRTGRFRLLGGSFTEPRSSRRGSGISKRSLMVADIKSGWTLRNIAITHPEAFLQHSRGVPTLINFFSYGEQKSNRSSIGVAWISGATDIGKTWFCRQYAHWRRQEIYVVPTPSTAGTIWFDGYLGQPIILIDDIGRDVNRRDQFSRNYLLTMMDPYSMQTQTKGGFVWAQWSLVLFTSNFQAGEIFHDDPALLRRLTYNVWAETRSDLPDMEVDFPVRTVHPFRDPPPLETAEATPPASQLSLQENDSMLFDIE